MEVGEREQRFEVMSSVMRKAMVYLGLSDDDYEDYGRNEEAQANTTRQQPATRVGADYSRGTTSIRPLSRSAEGGTATLVRPTVVRPL